MKTIGYYNQNADHFLTQYEKVNPEAIHISWKKYIPKTKSLIMDIGAGSGRDAAWFASMGHRYLKKLQKFCINNVGKK